MNKKRLIIWSGCYLLTACSEFYGYQPPAPLYGNKQVGSNPYQQQIEHHPVITDPVTKPVQQAKTEPRQQTVTVKNAPIYREAVVAKRKSSPAVLALVSQADRSSKAGDLESAVVTIERALRIDSRNPELTYKLALLRLKQSKPRLAEDLAKKAALLSVNDSALKKRSWLLISEARRQQKNYYGAKEAKLKADRL